MNRNAKIIATAHYLPERCVTNEELNERFTALGKPEVVGKFAAGTGIEQRWYAPNDWATSDVALPAASRVLEKAGRRPEDVDLIILGTDSPDYITPSTSVVLQHKLGAKRAGTFDVGCACASFPTALANAAGFLATNQHLHTILVVGAYMMRKLADPTDPTVFFYGDGAGAALVEPSADPGFIGASFLADGAYADCWGIYSGGTAEPATVESVTAGRTNVRLVKRYPPEINDEGWPKLFRQLATANNFAVGDVDQVIFTQVNRHSLELAADTIGLPRQKAPMIMAQWGYTGSACIPMALSKCVDEGRINNDDLVVMIGSGVGYNQAAVAFRM
ncbi:3-oxoacyl-ACP synthase III family protein [Aquisalimonas sp.]|uniref:3-oxoacyl-ACP synthase III family protein n=1 Tax=Aquisalimonas sp. TaxID=1872621 RepID=UPI0025C00AE9|nr:ketoacyl-ACP synthase III [Aquisalimonas sp.]